MNKPTFEALYTKEQILKILLSLNCTEPLPKKNQTLYINKPLISGGAITITKSDKKSTYGKALYLYCTGY
jgi:hypothetical protein